MSRTQDQLEFFTFGPSDDYIRRHPEAAPGEVDSVARVIDGMEPDAKEIVRRYNVYEGLQKTIAALENEKHVLEAALYEVAEIVADSDLDATTQLAQLSMALSGVEQAGLIDGDKVGTDVQPEVSDEYL